MNKAEQLATVYLDNKKRRDKSYLNHATEGAIGGGSIGALAPLLVTSYTPKKAQGILEKMPGGIGNMAKDFRGKPTAANLALQTAGGIAGTTLGAGMGLLKGKKEKSHHNKQKDKLKKIIGVNEK